MLLTARWLFTGTSTDLLENQVIQVDDGRIVDIRPRAGLPDTAEVVDLGDVHCCQDSSTFISTSR